MAALSFLFLLADLHRTDSEAAGKQKLSSSVDLFHLIFHLAVYIERYIN